MKSRGIVVFLCFAVSGFFVTNVLATARPGQATVTVPTVTTPTVTAPTVTTPTVTTPTVTAPTVTAPTVTTPTVTTPTVTTPTVTTPKVTTTTVSVATPITTVSVATPSSSPVVTSAADGGSAIVPARPGTPVSGGTGSVTTRRKPGTTSVVPQGSADDLGSPVVAVDGPSTGSESMASGAGAASIAVVASRAGRSAVFLSLLRVERLPEPRSGVGLRLVLSRPARVRFLVIGPAPSCRVAERFVFAGHKGANKMAFPGRVHGRRLGPGIYTIVPQPAVGSRRLPKAVAVAIDARGIHPTAPVRWQNCYTAAATRSSALTTSDTDPAWAPRASGVAAAETITPATRERTAEDNPFPVFDRLPSFPKSPQVSALLLGLLVVSMALLSLASVEPGHLLRFQAMRMLVSHRGHIALLGGATLVSAILLFLLL